MNERYLWDRSGEVDPELAALEEKLGRFRAAPWAPPRPRLPLLRIAAGIAALALVGWWAASAWSDKDPALPGVPKIEQAPYVVAEAGEGARVLTAQGEAIAGDRVFGHSLRPGDRVVAAGALPVELRADGIGRVTLDPGAELELLAHDEDVHRFDLHRGRIRAVILPPPMVRPRLFRLRTPAGEAIDLGCAYVVESHPDQPVRIEVQTGAVAFLVHDKEVWIPREHRLEIWPFERIALPFAIAAKEEFRSAASSYVSGQSKSGPPPIDVVLGAAGPGDEMTLWHVLQWGEERDRLAVAKVLIELMTMPDRFDVQALARLDPDALVDLRQAISGF